MKKILALVLAVMMVLCASAMADVSGGGDACGWRPTDAFDA